MNNITTDEEIHHLCINAFPKHHRLNNEQWNTLLEGFDKGFKAALSQNKVSDVTDLDVVLEQYSKDRDLSINDVRYALIPFVKWLKENYSGKVIDAVEFAEWINNNAYSQYYSKGYKKWYRRSLLSDGGFLTSQELYEKFKSEKPQITSK